MLNSVERRELPVYAAGAIHFPHVISRFQELMGRDTRWSEHSHPTHELLWNERGVSHVSVRSRTWMITPVLGLWMPAGVLHSGSAPAGTLSSTSHFGVQMVCSISDEPVAVELSPLLRLLLERLADTDLGDSSRHIAERAVLDLLVPAKREVFLHVPRAALLRPIVEAVQEDPGLDVSLVQWGATLGVSTRTITRAFQAESGTGFARWVAMVRAHRAVGLLSRGEDLEDVARLLGYGSTSAFGAAFKRTTGFTPSAFRAK